MKRTMRWVGVGLVFSLGWGVAGMQAQRPVAAEPQAPSGTVQAPREVVPPLPVPRLVKFAGTLRDELGKSRTGVVGVTFAVYKEQEGGAALWLETQNVELDEQGHYTVLLGTTKREGLPLELFTAGEPRWLGVQVNLPKEVEQPRVLLVSVPYALKAADADTLGGKPASVYLTTERGGGIGTSGNSNGGPRIVSSAVSGTGTTDVVARWVDNIGTLGNSSIFDNGLVGIGTTNPQASLDVQLTTGSPTNALNSTITLNNSSPITGSVLSAFKMTLVDASTAANLSKQPARFVYVRDASATGGVTAFDSVMTATSFLSADAPYQLRGINIEGPTVATGKTLSNFTGLYIGPPSGAGAITSRFALVTDANAGNVGIGTTNPNATLDVAGRIHVETGNNSFRVEGPLRNGTGLASFGGSGDFAIDAPTIVAGRFVVKDNGNVGIGVQVPGAKLNVNGDIVINGCYVAGSTTVAGICVSDARLKTNIRRFSPVLDKLTRLRPVHFYWKVADYPERHFDSSRSTGLIAQEVEKVLPELVSVDAQGFKRVNYTELPYLMLQAIKDLKSENDVLKEQNATLGRALQDQLTRLQAIELRLERTATQTAEVKDRL